MLNIVLATQISFCHVGGVWVDDASPKQVRNLWSFKPGHVDLLIDGRAFTVPLVWSEQGNYVVDYSILDHILL